MRTCDVAGCDRKHYGRGMCTIHYDRWRYHGDTDAIYMRGVPCEERFWSKVDKTEGCWNYLGSSRRPGEAGQFFCEGTTYIAYRWLWEHERGPIPPGAMLCHHCDNPLCVRLDHIYIGTHRTNMNDRVARKTGGRGARHGNAAGTTAKLTIDDAREIQRLYVETEASQVQLGRAFGVSQQTVSRIISGEHWLVAHQ